MFSYVFFTETSKTPYLFKTQEAFLCIFELPIRNSLENTGFAENARKRIVWYTAFYCVAGIHFTTKTSRVEIIYSSENGQYQSDPDSGFFISFSQVPVKIGNITKHI